MTTPERPRTLEAMRACLSRVHSEEAVAFARSFRPRPDDVFVATYPKSGTTWLQQVVYGLATGGSMDFDEISLVVPWLETIVDLGLDVEAPRPGLFRAFKTHATAAQVPPGARYVCALRDPADVLVSFYHFFEGWMFEPGAFDLDTFALGFFAAGSNSGRYWDHLVGWWARRSASDTLLLCYEDMVADLPAAVDHIAAFLQVSPPAPVRARIIEQAGFSFMSAHARLFDDHALRDARDAACGLPPGAQTSKLGKGKVGRGQALSPQVQAMLERRWREEVEPVTGAATYAELRARLRAGG